MVFADLREVALWCVLFSYCMFMSACIYGDRYRSAQPAKVTLQGHSQSARYRARVRVYTTPDYQRTHLNWRSHVASQIRAANEHLNRGFGLELQVTEMVSWSADCDVADLQGCLWELVALDPGEDVDWVVGLIGGLPMFADSFDKLGYATIPGRHFILRDLSSPAERDALDRFYPEVPIAKRDRLYAERLDHKRLAIFLHEWAHTLGATHTMHHETLMNARYDRDMSIFSDDNAWVIQSSLAQRFGEDAEANNDPATAGAPSHTPHPLVLRVPPDEHARLLAELSADDRGHYDAAVEHLHDGQDDDAWKELHPLLERHEGNLAIQHLGCGLAMKTGALDQAGTACNLAIQLTSGSTPAN